MRNIALFCASKEEIAPPLAADAIALGAWIASTERTLVYGGAALGLMEIAAEAVHTGGGNIIGVMPQSMIASGRASSLPHSMIAVENLSERKVVMMEQADAFVVLPGGVGTLDELFEVLSTAQLGFHSKPTILCNSAGFFTPLVDYLAWLEREGFSPKHLGRHLHVAANAAETIALLTCFEKETTL